MDFSSVKRSLSARHINVPDEWLTACIDWLHENLEPNKSFEQQIYEQWLASDLSELASVSLPANLGTQMKTVLHGHHALQINSIVDVSKSSYQQLTKLKGTDISNSEVTGDRPFEPKIRSSVKRLLMIDLTDGTQAIRGMEYQAIPDLNTNLPPGTKILVFGQIPFRMGVLLLKKENVKVLVGGGVEELAESFTQIKVLENRLRNTNENPERHSNLSTHGNRQQLPPSPDPSATKQKLTMQQLPIPQKKLKSAVFKATDSDSDLPWDDYMSELDESVFESGTLSNTDGNVNTLISQPSTSTSRPTPNPPKRNSIVSTSSNRHSNYEPLPKRLMTDRHFTPPPPSNPPRGLIEDNDFPDDLFDDDDFDDILDDVNVVPPSHQPRPHAAFTANSGQPAGIAGPPADLTVARNSARRDSNKHFPPFMTNALPTTDGNRTTTINVLVNASANSSTNRSSTTNPCRDKVRAPFVEKGTSKTDVDAFSWDDSDDDFDISVIEELEATDCGLKPEAGPSHLSQSGRRRSSETTSGDITTKCAEVTRRCLSGSGPVTASHSTWTSASATKHPSGESDAPFSYLCQLPALPFASIIHTRIKGFIMTIWKTLSRQNGEWSLEVEINDGSASFTAVLTNKVLVKLIGLTVEESVLMKAAGQADRVIKKKYKQTFVNSSDRFNSLCCLMDLEILPGSCVPKVIGVVEVNGETLRQLIIRAY